MSIFYFYYIYFPDLDNKFPIFKYVMPKYSLHFEFYKKDKAYLNASNALSYSLSI